MSDLRAAAETLLRRLDRIPEICPVTIFPPLTQDEYRTHGILITRIMADTVRQVAQAIRKDTEELREALK